MAGKRAVVFTHEALEGPGMLGPALERAGFTLELRFREVRPGDAEAPLVVVMGGGMAVYEASRHPFLLDELRLLRERVERQAPVVGICLGAQLLAAAAGARVFKGPLLEVGVSPVTLTSQGTQDAVLGPLAPAVDVAHWHGDTFDAVPGAVRLASSATYQEQAFRLGPSYGLQFHLELEPLELEKWLNGPPRVDPQDPLALERLDQALPRLRDAVDRLARHCAQVA